jgi:3-deoxy-D-manno-octulosonic-acid transferase
MGILYNIIFILFAFFYLPIFLFKGRRRRGLALRFGIYPEKLVKSLGEKKNVWVHAVSVGEVIAVLPLIKEIREKHPDYRVVITTVTETGSIVAEKITSGDEIVIFLPYDITFIIRKVIKYIMPAALIIVETELWPNLIRETAGREVKIFLVNGRISDNSFSRYKLIRFLLKNLLAKISLLFMQTEDQKKRIISLGADPRKVKASGNMKFDSIFSEDTFEQDKEKIRLSLGLGTSDKLFIAGSTHPGEEKIILSSYIKLKKKFSGLRLLIAPRHIERIDEVRKVIIGHGLNPVFISGLSAINSKISAGDILILDTIGRLRSLYRIAEIAFVGGSLVKKGGQNMIEPATFAKPLLLGPYTHNFRDIVEMFLEKNAAIVVKDTRALTESLRGLLSDATLRDSLGQSAQRVAQSSRGATARILQSIEDENVFL